MSNTPAHSVDVEELVRQVLARLAGGAAPSTHYGCACQTSKPAANHDHGACQCPDKGGAKAHPAAAAAPTSATLVWADRVLTVGDLKGRLSGVRSVVAGPQTIVTPSASDLLRELGIGLSRGDGTAPGAKAGALIVATAGTDYCTEALRKHLNQRGIETARVPRGGLIPATQAALDEAATTGRPALLITGQTLAAVSLANRRQGIRAAAARTVEETRQALTEIGANVIAVDPARCSAVQIQRIARELATAAATCPLELAAALN